ncbi:MAG: hypothetical protein COB98_00250 [Flavobacteriaceae bacterium]|nr:MAG: hypothetical protein COB98_00250 [Flavobacteriaceae bacterium]
MKNEILENLFEFWDHISTLTGESCKTPEFKSIQQEDFLWPSKIYNISLTRETINYLYQEITSETIPNSLNTVSNTDTDNALKEQGFELKSTLEAMFVADISPTFLNTNTSSVHLVDTIEMATIFTEIASSSFGYNVLPNTIIDLIKSDVLHTYIGIHKGDYVSCGMLFLDKQGHVGLHMIGTLTAVRGLGIGKIMTQHLVQKASGIAKGNIVLVASKAGAFIYKKMGFKVNGALKRYHIKKTQTN